MQAKNDNDNIDGRYHDGEVGCCRCDSISMLTCNKQHIKPFEKYSERKENRHENYLTVGMI